MMGGQGVISVASNIIPGEMCEFMRTAVDARTDEAAVKRMKDMQERYNPLFGALFPGEPSPEAVKYALHRLGMINPESDAPRLRSPLGELMPVNKSLMDKALHELELLR